jgi:hypothetical protein
MIFVLAVESRQEIRLIHGLWETHVAEQVMQKRPIYCVECFRNIYLQEFAGSSLGMTEIG